jgi:nicotinamide mononucleotide transporter
MEQFWSTFLQDIYYTKWQEWVSTLAQVLSVWYARKNNILVYPTGIIGVVLAAWVYLFVALPPLYADGILNIYYLALSIYGWYAWSKKENGQVVLDITFCSSGELSLGLIGSFVAWLMIYFLLLFFTDSDTPVLDALVSASALTAMWWMASRKIENWLAWIFSNLVAIPLNFYKGFALFTLMYIIFLGLACWGYVAWRKDFYRSQKFLL